MAKGKKKSKFGGTRSDVDRREKAGSSYGYLNLPKGLTIYKESKGEHLLNFIAYIVSDENHRDRDEMAGVALVDSAWYKKPILTHRSIGVNNDSVVCPRTANKKCPICEHRDQQFRDKVDQDEMIGKAQLRNIYLIIPKDHKEYDEKIHIWDISNGNFQEELDSEILESSELDGFCFPDTGVTLKVRFKEKSFSGNKYFAAKRIDPDGSHQYDEDLIKKYNLDEIVKIHTYKELEAMFLELDEEEVEGDTKEEEVKSTRTKKDKKGKKEKGNKKDKKEAKELERIADEAEQKKEEKNSKKDKKEPKEKKKDKKKKEDGNLVKEGECPEGYKFGKEFDEYDECDECEVREACERKHKKLTA